MSIRVRGVVQLCVVFFCGFVGQHSCSNTGLYYGTVVFYLSFWAFLCVIFLNVIFGVIVDTFADLRDKNKARVPRAVLFVNRRAAGYCGTHPGFNLSDTRILSVV